MVVSLFQQEEIGISWASYGTTYDTPTVVRDEEQEDDYLVIACYRDITSAIYLGFLTPPSGFTVIGQSTVGNQRFETFFNKLNGAEVGAAHTITMPTDNDFQLWYGLVRGAEADPPVYGAHSWPETGQDWPVIDAPRGLLICMFGETTDLYDGPSYSGFIRDYYPPTPMWGVNMGIYHRPVLEDGNTTPETMPGTWWECPPHQHVIAFAGEPDLPPEPDDILVPVMNRR